MMQMDCAIDRISDLPRDITDKILLSMPLRDAVRTSTLSSQWRYKWTTIPDLVFDPDSFNENNVEAMVDQVFSLHEGTINKFSLTNFRIQSDSSISRWLSYLSEHGIKSLELSLYYLNRDPVTVRLTDFDHLQHLHLGNPCDVKIPPSLRGFNSLTKLELFKVNIDVCDLEVLLSKCPMIEYLDVKIFMHGVMNELPNKLKYLTALHLGYVNFIDLRNIDVLVSLIKSSPNLQTLKLYGSASRDEYCITIFLKILHAMNPCICFLEDVAIDFMMGDAARLEFVKTILRWTDALKGLGIDDPIASRDNVSTEFENFKRALLSKAGIKLFTPKLTTVVETLITL
ncbi:F-box/FBD/LRR-repeat protein At1g13570-like [Andrographis paniculata]|uniref:F-box/FBD/LRR-repeat protein At1g13570-like n=1 Tax=Andrographis paniculata TaxID=175694 RepID=UPI0021E855C3|nr:F-box/FBD/LRR-repeat protein At1g13570-like [Andrographis paniculata]